MKSKLLIPWLKNAHLKRFSGYYFITGGADCSGGPQEKLGSVPTAGADGLTCALVPLEVAAKLLADPAVQKKWCVEEKIECRKVSGEPNTYLT